jgi:hypothetical protein
MWSNKSSRNTKIRSKGPDLVPELLLLYIKIKTAWVL